MNEPPASTWSARRRIALLAKSGSDIRFRISFCPRRMLPALSTASGIERTPEFLGDSILGRRDLRILFHRFPNIKKGALKIKSVVVVASLRAKVSQRLGLDEFLLLGKGMSLADGLPQSLLADVFESLVAAVYLDGGHAAVRDMIERHIAPEIDVAVDGEHAGNYKSVLQHLAQREFGTTPTYQLLDEKGPDHSKCFQIAAVIGRNRYAPAWGRNKKESEQRAAHNALCERQ
jgi:ribonuclease-3